MLIHNMVTDAGARLDFLSFFNKYKAIKEAFKCPTGTFFTKSTATS